MQAGPGRESGERFSWPPIRRGTAHWAALHGTVVTSTVTAGGKPVQRTQPDDAAAASEEQRVTENDNDQTSDEVTVETTSVFRSDFLNELEAPAQADTETTVSGVEGLPVGSALLVVKRGPNAGSRFLLDQPTTSAGRHPDSDIFLDDVTVSRRHAEFRLETDEFHVVDVGSLNGTYVNREPVDSAVLANGDEVQIGKFRLVFLTGPKGGDDNGGPGS
jgi:pSer/pThr/pTyr-binding forkhead associated (FHA) protein